MVKKDERGFVLAEAIIVSTFVLGLFAYLATSLFPLISKYKNASNYDNPEEIYLAYALYDEIVFRGDNDEIEDKTFYYKYNNKYNNTCSNEFGNPTSLCDIYSDLIYNYLDIEEILMCKNINECEKVSYLSRSMRQYYNFYKIKPGINNTMLIKFKGNKFASVNIGGGA